MIIAAALVALAACSSTPEPVAEMASARTAVRSVEDTSASKLAPVLLDRAKSKLQRAEAAMKDEQYDEARRLAEESLADAQLARAQSDALAAQRNANELEESIRVLRSEIDRSRESM
jgi:flagellin-specific chaperone FliS